MASLSACHKDHFQKKLSKRLAFCKIAPQVLYSFLATKKSTLFDGRFFVFVFVAIGTSSDFGLFKNKLKLSSS